MGLAWPIVDGWVISGDQYKLYAIQPSLKASLPVGGQSADSQRQSHQHRLVCLAVPRDELDVSQSSD
jgi:hypothetical protein